MEITTDIQLRGSVWSSAINKLGNIFRPRTNYDAFMLSLAIGIMYDKRISTTLESGDEIKSVPRNVLQNHDNGKLDYYFQAAILSSTTVEYDEDQRLELAFGESSNFKKIEFLTEFANFGITKLDELSTDDPIETMENLKGFATSSIEGTNYEIDALPDDILIEYE